MGSAALAELSRALLSVQSDPRVLAYIEALRNSTFADDLKSGSLTMEWAVTHMISDDPTKGLGLAEPGSLIFNKLRKSMGEPVGELNLERLTKPFNVPPADEGAGHRQKRLVDVGSTLMTDAQSAKPV